ncbi:MAG: hypothetical protein WCW26_04540 [Candidatus Buchananbacteria bacterium]
MKNYYLKNNTIKKDKANKFITGEPRYCQNCGKESHQLFEITKNAQKIEQLQYCKTCVDIYQAKNKPASSNRTK